MRFVDEPTFVAPKFLVAQHNLSTRPAVLYWYDLPAMLAVAGIPFPEPQQQESVAAAGELLLLVTQVKDDDDDVDGGTAAAATTTTTSATALPASSSPWPVQPTADKVGDFKVSPAVHVGYAATWYGLSAAGIYMTRMLLTRGR